jgi:hypothetical protein
MRHSFLAAALLTIDFLLSAAPITGQAAPPPDSQKPSEQAVNFSPARVPRGKSFRITFAVPPPGDPQVAVCLAGQLIPAQKGDGHGTYDVVVPDPPPDKAHPKPTPCDAHENPPKDSIPLGTYNFSVSYNGQWFAVRDPINIVKTDQQPPILREVQPEQISHEPGKQVLKILGSNFIIDPAEDNTILVGGSPVQVGGPSVPVGATPIPVKWDGCPTSATDATDSIEGLHGQVKSSEEIDLCGVKLPSQIETNLLIRQGELVSNVIKLRVVAWADSSVLGLSFFIPIAAVALVVFLASFLPAYKINKTTYGMFTILFLDPETNTYSLSKYQFYLWTLAALFSYTYFALSRVLIQNGSLPDVPSSLPGIIAIAAGTAIGSQVVTAVRGPKGSGQELPSLGDFVTSVGGAAPERVQMFVWTNLGVLAFCLVTLHSPSWQISELPRIQEGLMYLMGISSAGYLGGKLARKPGPVISEISVSPASPGPIPPAGATAPTAGARPSALAPALASLAQPITAAQQANRDIQAAISPITAASAPAAFTAAQTALQALRTGITAATTGGIGMLSTLADSASAADAASQSAAAEFAQVFAVSDSDPRLETLRVLAEQAQFAAAAAQDLATAVSLATAVAQAPAPQPDPGPTAPAIRVIELRGRNLSVDATFEINGEDLPFRMLTKVGESRAPKIVAPEDDANQPTLARELRLSIDPASLGDTDKKSYDSWFNPGASSLRFTITNPDGQQSRTTLTFPPGEEQTRSTSNSGAAA